MALVEALPLASGRASHQRQRAAGDVRQHAVGDGEVILGEILFGDALLGIKHLAGVGQPHSRDSNGVLGSG